MQIVRFQLERATCFGVLDGAVVVECSGTPWTALRRGRRRHPLRQVILLSPVLPSKIVAVGLNHREHAAALGRAVPAEPLIFLKPVSAMIGLDDPIVAPPTCGRLECEGELAVVMKRRCRNVAPARARDYVLGYTALNDVTARDIQVRDGDWTRAKAFDTFCPVGPGIVTDLDPNAVTIETWVIGSLVRAASTKELLVPVEDLVARVSEVMTLLPGDVLATGSPGMAAPIAPGDRIEVRVEGVGCLKNSVVRL